MQLSYSQVVRSTPRIPLQQRTNGLHPISPPAPSAAQAIAKKTLANQAKGEKSSSSKTFLIKKIESCQLQELVQVAREIRHLSWEIVKLEKGDAEKYLTQLRHATQQEIQAFTCQEVARMTWFLSQATHLDLEELNLRKDVKIVLSKTANKYLPKMQAGDLVDIACAFDDLEYRDTPLFKNLSREIQRIIKNFKPQQISLAAFAFRKFQLIDTQRRTTQVDTKLYTALYYSACPQINQFRPPDIGFMTKGFAQAELRDPNLFDRLSHQIVKEIHNFRGNDIAHTLWAYAYMNTYVEWHPEDQLFAKGFNQRILEPLKNAAIERVQELDAKDTVRVAWSFESFYCTDLKLFEVLGQRVIQEIDNFTLQEISNLIKTFTNVGCLDEKVLFLLFETAKGKINQFSPSDIVKIAGGLTIAYCSSYKMNIEGYVKIFLGKIFELNSLMDKHQLSYSWIEEELSHINTIYKLYYFKSKDDQPLPESLERAIANYFNKLRKKPPESSGLHGEVATVLKRMGKQAVNEYPFESFFLDLAYPDKKWVIEVDGDTHFEKDSEKYREKNKVKNTLLELEGWKLSRIPGFEWRKKEDFQSQRDYLQAELDQLEKQTLEKSKTQ